MSKRDDEPSSSADIEVGMTTAERRRRRRRGALRVPSDNVPRQRAATSPPVVAPVPEDPALAMSIAYSFTSDASEPIVRAPAEGVISHPAPSILAHPPHSDFAPVAPEAASTLIEPPAAPVESQDFEIKTREMAAVDLEALGLQELEPRQRPSAREDLNVTSVGEVPSVIVEEEEPDVISAFRDRRVKTDPMVDGPPDEQNESPIRAARDADVDVDVGGLDNDPPIDPPSANGAGATAAGVTATDLPVVREHVPATPPPPPKPGEMSSPGIALSDEDLEATSIHNIPIRPEPSVLGPIPVTPAPPVTPPVVPAGKAEATGRPRLKTVALSEEDLEEVLVAARAASQPAAARARPPTQPPEIPAAAKAPTTTIPGVGSASSPSPLAAAAPAAAAPIDTADSKRTQPLSALDLEAERPADASGDFEVDVDVATDSDRHEVQRPSQPPPLPPAPSILGTPAAAKDGAHPPPPPPAASERRSAPPTPPVPTKKHSTPVAPAVTAAAAKQKEQRGKPWFVDLFDEDYLRTLPFLTAQATQAEAEFVIDAMTLQPGAQLLDVGCGYGRHAMELAARGYHVVGLDLSTPLLVRGGEESHRRGLTINFVRGDMRELDFDSQFDGAYCLFSTFGYFDDETNKKALANIARALRPGGRVLIEILNRDYVIADLPTRVWWEGDGCVVLEEVELNYFSSRIQVNRSVVFDDGRQLEQEISIRAYALHEVGKLMHAAGFRVLEVSGGYQTRGRFFGNQSRHIIVLAERKEPSAT